MKNSIIILTIVVATCIFASCSGDRTPQNGKDTIANRFGTAKDTTKIDTAKTTSSDNSASGGANAVKIDSSKK